MPWGEGKRLMGEEDLHWGTPKALGGFPLEKWGAEVGVSIGKKEVGLSHQLTEDGWKAAGSGSWGRGRGGWVLGGGVLP